MERLAGLVNQSNLMTIEGEREVALGHLRVVTEHAIVQHTDQRQMVFYYSQWEMRIYDSPTFALCVCLFGISG